MFNWQLSLIRSYPLVPGSRGGVMVYDLRRYALPKRRQKSDQDLHFIMQSIKEIEAELYRYQISCLYMFVMIVLTRILLSSELLQKVLKLKDLRFQHSIKTSYQRPISQINFQKESSPDGPTWHLQKLLGVSPEMGVEPTIGVENPPKMDGF